MRNNMSHSIPDEPVPAHFSASQEAFRNYDEFKLRIAAIAQAAMQCGRELGDEEGIRAHQRLLARLAEDRFNLAVLGNFSRGKSSLMNALLGVDRLPTGLLPHTSVITSVGYGDQERVIIRQEGWSLPHEVPLGELAQYVTEEGNPGNCRRVSSAEVQLPLELLRHGLYFIDTPGVGSAIAANTLTTRQFLPQADCAIFVTSFDSPPGDYEIEFVREVRSIIGKVFIVINKLDLVSGREKEQVLAYVRERLEAVLGESGFDLFAVSARDGLRAKLAGDRASLQRSGLIELETALVHFLAAGKTQQLCRRVLDRLIGLVEWQKIELSLAGANSRNAHTTLAQIKSVAEAFQARRRELTAGLRKTVGAGINFPLDRYLDPVFTQLQADALAKFAPRLVQGRDALFMPSHTRTVVGETSSFLAHELADRIGARGAFVEKALQALAGSQMAELKGLPDELWSELIRVASGTEKIIDLPLEQGEIVFNEPAGPRFERIQTKRRLPWAFYFAPLAWTGEAINHWFVTALSELMAGYRREAHAWAGVAIDESVSQLDREVEKQIEARSQRIRDLVTAKGEKASHVQLLDSLISRAIGLRKELEVPHAEVRADLQSVKLGPAGIPAAAQGFNCPVCDRVGDAIFQLLSKRQYELSSWEASQQEHARSGGFCATHTWMLAALTSPQGICRAYPELLLRHGRALRGAAMSSASTLELEGAARALVQSGTKCSVCIFIHRTEIETVAELISGQLESNGRNRAPAPVLCLPHLSLALRAAPDLSVARTLALATAA